MRNSNSAGERIAVLAQATQALTAALMAASDRDELPRLTPRRREVHALLLQNKSPMQIKDELGVSEETARSHVFAVCKAYGVRSYKEFWS